MFTRILKSVYRLCRNSYGKSSVRRVSVIHVHTSPNGLLGLGNSGLPHYLKLSVPLILCFSHKSSIFVRFLVDLDRRRKLLLISAVSKPNCFDVFSLFCFSFSGMGGTFTSGLNCLFVIKLISLSDLRLSGLLELSLSLFVSGAPHRFKLGRPLSFCLSLHLCVFSHLNHSIFH